MAASEHCTEQGPICMWGAVWLSSSGLTLRFTVPTWSCSPGWESLIPGRMGSRTSKEWEPAAKAGGVERGRDWQHHWYTGEQPLPTLLVRCENKLLFVSATVLQLSAIYSQVHFFKHNILTLHMHISGVWNTFKWLGNLDHCSSSKSFHLPQLRLYNHQILTPISPFPHLTSCLWTWAH